MLFWGSEGGPLGPRWPTDSPLTHVRWVERKIDYLAVLRGNHWSLHSRRVAKEYGLVLRVNFVVWGL